MFPTTGCFPSKSWESDKGPVMSLGNLMSVPRAHALMKMRIRKATRRLSFDLYSHREACVSFPHHAIVKYKYIIAHRLHAFL